MLKKNIDIMIVLYATSINSLYEVGYAAKIR